jgi:hypothetical protein
VPVTISRSTADTSPGCDIASLKTPACIAQYCCNAARAPSAVFRPELDYFLLAGIYYAISACSGVRPNTLERFHEARGGMGRGGRRATQAPGVDARASGRLFVGRRKR